MKTGAAILLMSASLWLVCCRLGYEELPSAVLDGSGASAATEGASTGGSAVDNAAGDSATSGGSGATTNGGSSSSPGSATDGAGGDATAGAPDSGGSGGSANGGSAAGGMGGSAGNGGAAGNGGTAGGSSIGPCTATTYGGHKYWVCTTPKSYVDAAIDCATKGYRPARIDSAGEQTFVHDQIPVADQNNNNTNLWRWLGGNASGAAGDWQWSDGTQFWTGGKGGSAVGGAYTNWSTNQPINSQSCLAMEARSGAWDALDCFAAKPYVCEQY